MAPVKKYRPTTDLFFAVLMLVLAVYSQPGIALESRPQGVSAATLGVVINLDDPQSVAVGEYYQKRRSIPAANIIRVHVRADTNTLSESEFRILKASIDRQTRSSIQAYALTWVRPYRVECMSMTTAIAAGFNRDYCSEGCKTTRVSAYYDSNSREPMLDAALRPTMMLAATSLKEAKALIDRGVAADSTAPKGTAYLVNTRDTARNVRTPRFALAQDLFGNEFSIRRMDAESLTDASDVMFYFIGAVHVPNLTSNRFLPGAVADHLTSTGGDLLSTSQMSSLRWLEAGATASYGTVVEPCAFPAKFPDPVVMMKHYFAGETLIEAYWKSVAMPGQGLFIGEPLAKPF